MDEIIREVLRKEGFLSGVSRDSLAYMLMRLYFEEIARKGMKKGLSLEEIMNAYFYCLHRLGNEEEEIKKIKVAIENKKLKDLFPDVGR